MNKSDIVKAVNSLLNSALKRDTAQGVLVYEFTLDRLLSANSGEQLQKILVELNKALTGIEAHGYFTDEEFNIVKSLRKLAYAQDS